MNYIILKEDNIIENIVVAEPAYAESKGWVSYQEGWGIGDQLIFSDGKWNKIIEEISEKQLIVEELAVIDSTYRTPRTIAAAQLGDAIAINRLETAEQLSAELRKKLKNLSHVEQ